MTFQKTKDIIIRRYRPNENEINYPSLLLGKTERATLSVGLFVRAGTIWTMINNILRVYLISIKIIKNDENSEIRNFPGVLYARAIQSSQLPRFYRCGRAGRRRALVVFEGPRVLRIINGLNFRD